MSCLKELHRCFDALSTESCSKMLSWVCLHYSEKHVALLSLHEVPYSVPCLSNVSLSYTHILHIAVCNTSLAACFSLGRIIKHSRTGFEKC